MRVVSLLPAATELLDAVGGADLLVGRSAARDHPASIAHLPAVDRAALSALRPDVILARDRSSVGAMDFEAEIVAIDPRSMEDVFDDLLRVGRAVDRADAAQAALVALRERYWTAVDYVTPFAEGPVVGFLEGIDPLVVPGRWTPQLIEAAGGRHPLNPAGEPSRDVTPDEFVASAPQRLIICPRGLDVPTAAREVGALLARPWWNDLPAVRAGRVAVVDGHQMFHRPGPRLVTAFRWLVGWINDRPEVMPRDFPARNLTAPAEPPCRE